MIFSSTVFLFQFLPAALAVYYAAVLVTRKHSYANAALLAISLLFYFIGSGYLVLLLVFSVVANFVFAKRISIAGGRSRKGYLTAGIATNLAILMYFKYAGFLLQSGAQLAAFLHIPLAVPVLEVALPVGISFYTFMSISYLIDVYKGGEDAASLPSYAVYLTLFPHLVAGPIVRYSELRDAIAGRHTTSEDFLAGIFRFSVGVARKVIIADSLALVADRIFALPSPALTPAVAWLGVVCYAFQIFYDFSGYTDMAIGLARMFGFRFPENFAQPYAAGSITEFWRRWHMTLTRWFRDYLYIPLGGNRRGGLRTYANLFIVFFLCGLWHGAAWTFVAWGIYHGLLLVIERVLKHRFGFEPSGIGGVLISFLLVTVGWVFFRATSIAGAAGFLSAMFTFRTAGAAQLSDYLTASTIFYLAVAALFAVLPLGTFDRLVGAARSAASWKWQAAQGSLAVLILILSIAYVSETTFRPFIYFRF